jgi:serine phosphatase RsbU (regulator of sigma subunit)
MSRSLLGVALLVQDRVIGVLTVGSKRHRAFTDEDEQLLRLAGDRVALAVEHARLYERERDTADALQRSLLPERLPDIPGAALAVCYRPAHYQVGGDFYDVFALDSGGWIMVLGDVCGKGPEAAAVTALARYTLRAEAQHQPRPAALLSALNTALLRQRPAGPYLTAIVAHLLAAPEGALTVTVSAGGHPSPIVVHRTGRARELATHGTLIGFDRDVTFSNTVARLENGETILLYTDGVLEAHAPSRILTEQDVLNALTGTTVQPPRAILEQVERLAGIDAPDMPLRDDIAILALQALNQTEKQGAATAPPHAPGRR